MKDFKNITALKGLFALLIIVNHFDPLVSLLPGYSMQMVMVAFFVFSGFCLTLRYRDRFVQTDNIRGEWGDFIIKRYSKIYPLQWLVVITNVIFGINVVTYWAVPFHLTLTQSLVPFWEINFSLNAATWFLSSIAILYLVFPFAVRSYFKRKKVSVLLFIVGLAAFSLVSVFLPSSIGRRWMCYINPFARFFDFAFGILLADFYMSRKAEKNVSSTICSILELIACALLAYSLFRPEWWPAQYYHPAVMTYPVVAFLVLVFSLQERGVCSKVFKSKAFQFLGQNSFAIYMTHGFVIAILKQANIDWRLMFALIVVITIALSYVITNYYIPYTSGLFSLVLKKWTSRR